MEFYNKNNSEAKLEEEKKEDNSKIQTEKSDKIYKLDTTNIKNNRKKIVAISIISACALILLLLLCTGFALVVANSNKVITGVSINGIAIKGFTKDEAIFKLNEEIEKKLNKDIIFKTEDFEYSIKLSQIEAKYNIEKTVEDALKTGRDGNIFLNNFEIIKTMVIGKNIDLPFEYNEKLLDDVVTDIAVKIPNAVVEPNYYIENETLYINKGKKGNSIDKEKIKNTIIDILKDNDGDLNIELDIIEIEPEDIDIEKIHNEVYKEPKDAYYTKDPFQIYPHEDGIDFDVEEARKVLVEDKEEYEIKLKITKPKVTTSELGTEAFPDLLSTFSTKYDASNKPRTTNLILAMQKLDGVVVAPGETFSYNKTLGKRTAEAGYKEAGGFAGGRVVQTLAGGICQISSTLYDAAVYANLEIVERHNHMFLAGYVEAGKDATVVYGSYDFKFKNTRNFPVMIKTSIGSGVAKISIFGIKEDVEYEVEISTKVLSYIPFSVIYEDDASLAEGQQKVVQNGMNGCKSITYKILKLNGKQVSSSVLSTDAYDAMNKIIKRGPAKTVETVAEPETSDPEPENETLEPEIPSTEPQESTPEIETQEPETLSPEPQVPTPESETPSSEPEVPVIDDQNT